MEAKDLAQNKAAVVVCRTFMMALFLFQYRLNEDQFIVVE